MTTKIYLIDSKSQRPKGVEPVAFSEVGIKERSDLQEWIAANPEVLGGPLLVIATEFSVFRSSKRRIDLLCIDRSGVLTVVEVKLDARGTHADLQAIRYAAFCSTMDAEQVCAALSAHRKCSIEEAETAILEFLEAEELPEFGDEPRIILAAGVMDDIEVTSAVLWLRKFGLDVRCIELTPYKPGSELILVPKQIIPLPEAEEYQVRVESKETAKVQQRRGKDEYATFWSDVARRYAELDPKFPVGTIGRRRHQPIRTGTGPLHYEWRVRRNPSRLLVSLDFEFPEEAENAKWVEFLKPHADRICEGVSRKFVLGRFGASWSQCMFEIPFADNLPGEAERNEAARLMMILIERTWPLVQRRSKGRDGDGTARVT